MDLHLRYDQPKQTVAAGEVIFGSLEVIVMAGPCAVEGRDSYLACARSLMEMGVRVLRGGAFKPRTSPYSFAGLGRDGLKILAEAGEATGMAVVTEVLDPRDVELVAAHVDILQIGSRNMQNFTLLHEVGQSGHPVMLKRGMAATCEEWLLAAEHIRAAGNERIILCERGIRTWSQHARNTLDVSVIPAARQLTHLPVIADPSHATGRRDLVIPCARAAVAAGADGLIVETHCQPDRALSDGPQALLPSDFFQLLDQVRRIREVLTKDGMGIF